MVCDYEDIVSFPSYDPGTHLSHILMSGKTCNCILL
jgi:hypothetical protein